MQYQKVIDDYPTFSLTDDAYLGIAECYYKKGYCEKTKTILAKVLAQYPSL
ncbi:MAG TPA: tetratricopeptide repeat protein [Terriglobales bacterium]